jgi:hypothetical protein
VPYVINGLPLHPLVVHAVVVLLPLAAIGVVAIAVRPRWRARFGLLVVIVAALATVAIPVATQSGEHLERQVGDPGLHAELGDTLIWFALPLLVLAALLWWLGRKGTSGAADQAGSPSGRRIIAVTLAVLAIAVAAANLVQVYRIGDTGAKAVWGDTATSAKTGGQDGG